MNEQLFTIIEKIQAQDPLHAKKLKRNLKNLDEDYIRKCDDFLAKYSRYLESSGKNLDYGITCYMKMIGDFMYEQLRFMESGEYSNSSFDEVNKRVYNNPEVMEYFMNGLLLSQVLWKHHYKIFSFFSEKFPHYSSKVASYLEIGGGHGLFISEALKQLGNDTRFHLLDISPTSIEVSKKFIGNHQVEYILKDIFEYQPSETFDFISMGEVLEHVEDPVHLLEKLKTLLNPDGIIFMTTPTNAPSIDHIYLFRNAEEVMEVIEKSGLEIIEDIRVYAEDLPEEKAIELKITMMYGCFMRIKK